MDHARHTVAGLRAFALPELNPRVDETRRNHEEPTVHGQEGRAPVLRLDTDGRREEAAGLRVGGGRRSVRRFRSFCRF